MIPEKTDIPFARIYVITDQFNLRRKTHYVILSNRSGRHHKFRSSFLFRIFFPPYLFFWFGPNQDHSPKYTPSTNIHVSTILLVLHTERCHLGMSTIVDQFGQTLLGVKEFRSLIILMFCYIYERDMHHIINK
jgi:hypothetical protein